MPSEPIPVVPFSILHPTDFSEGSMLAFCHALKIAVEYKASLSILHVDSERSEDARWEDFPGVRATLQRWGLLPPTPHAAPSSMICTLQWRKSTPRDR